MHVVSNICYSKARTYAQFFLRMMEVVRKVKQIRFKISCVYYISHGYFKEKQALYCIILFSCVFIRHVKLPT